MLTRTPSTRIAQAQSSDLVGHAFDEEKPRVFDEVDHVFGDRLVIHRVLDLVGAGGGPRIDVESQIDQNVLLVLALIMVDADDRA